MPERRLNGLSAWAPFILSVVVAVGALGVGWGKLSSAADQVEDNKASIEAIKKDLTAIKIGNAVIQEKQRNDIKKADEFRKETGQDLSNILRALQGREPSDGR